MDFKEYDNFIKEHKFDILHFIIYYNLKCNELSKGISEDNMKTLISFIYDAYLEDENHIDLGHICDKALDLKKEILNEDFEVYDLLEECDVIL